MGFKELLEAKKAKAAAELAAKEQAAATIKEQFTNLPTAAPSAEPKELSFSERMALKKAQQNAAKGKTTVVELNKPDPVPATPPSERKLSFSERAALRRAAIESGEAKDIIGTVTKPANNNEHTLSNISFNGLVLNIDQAKAVELASAGQSFVLTGAAGTGKTFTQAAVVEALEKQGAFGQCDFKYLGEKQPSIAIVAFTKVAVRNIQKAIRKNDPIAHFADHCMTIHSLLEYEPVQEEREDEDGNLYGVKVFRPQRNSENPLTLTHLIVEEASMVGIDLWLNIVDAISTPCQIIFLGDINQLQPVFSKPILGYGLCKLPVIELKEVYRQALESPIIYNAHQVLKGLPITSSEDGKVAIISHPSGTKIGQDRMAQWLKGEFLKLYKSGEYDPDQDIILLPYNKQFMGTDAINEWIAFFLSYKAGTMVQEVRAGRRKVWLAVGDKVLCDKRAGKIISIKENPKYTATMPPMAGPYMRDGSLMPNAKIDIDFDAVDDDLDDYSDFSGENIELEEAKRAASHIVTVAYEDQEGATGTLSTGGAFSEATFQFGYAMTIHKAQGSEWRKVFMAIHESQKGFCSRELIYTGLTRAREEFVMFAYAADIQDAVKRQAIKGDTLVEKIHSLYSGALGDLDQIPVEINGAS